MSARELYGALARAAVTPEYDIVVESRYGSFITGVARTNFVPMREYVSMPFPTEAEARAEANRYYTQLRSGGLAAWARSVSLYRADDLAAMHPRQAEALRPVPRRHRRVVASRAHLLQNLRGGILSGCLYDAVAEYQSVGPWELERRSRRDNHRAMTRCAADGCEGCARSVG